MTHIMLTRLAVTLAFLLTAALAVPVRAQDGDIAAVITQQMEDFRADDFTAAFDHASPKIRGLFGTAENFSAMVRGQYPMVHRPGSFRFLDQRETGGETQQIVEVEDMQGRRFLLRYDMIATENGWKINGVSVVPMPDVAA